MNNLFWSLVMSIVLNPTPNPMVLDQTQVSKMLDVSCLIHAKQLIENSDTGQKEQHRVGCSGTFVGDNEVLTAAHCFAHDTVDAWVRTPAGDSHKVDKIIRISSGTDLALLHVIGPKHVFAKLSTHNPRVGDDVFNVGSPYFLEFLVSNGLVSALHVKTERFTGEYFISTAMINPGSSGGGAFNRSGDLIGVNTMSVGGPFGWAGITMTVSLETIKVFLQ